MRLQLAEFVEVVRVRAAGELHTGPDAHSDEFRRTPTNSAGYSGGWSPTSAGAASRANSCSLVL